MISVYFVNGNSIECCDDESLDPNDFIEEFQFKTIEEVASFCKGIEAGSRYDDTEASTFLNYSDALKCCRKAIAEWHGKDAICEE